MIILSGYSCKEVLYEPKPVGLNSQEKKEPYSDN